MKKHMRPITEADQRRFPVVPFDDGSLGYTAHYGGLTIILDRDGIKVHLGQDGDVLTFLLFPQSGRTDTAGFYDLDVCNRLYEEVQGATPKEIRDILDKKGFKHMSDFTTKEDRLNEIGQDMVYVCQMFNIKDEQSTVTLIETIRSLAYSKIDLRIEYSNDNSIRAIYLNDKKFTV